MTPNSQTTQNTTHRRIMGVILNGNCENLNGKMEWMLLLKVCS